MVAHSHVATCDSHFSPYFAPLSSSIFYYVSRISSNWNIPFLFPLIDLGWLISTNDPIWLHLCVGTPVKNNSESFQK